MFANKPGKPFALLLMGATATGKTDLAVKLHERFPVEIISVDSALIYRDMNLGTAKPDAETLEKAPHFLIDILDPAESWSAWNFVQQATELIQQINQRQRIPLLVGGTMMYFHALERGMSALPESDATTRQQLTQKLKELGLDAMYQRLLELDPESASTIKPTDPQRILRALEVISLSGHRMSELLQQGNQKPDIEFSRLMLEVTERSVLHQRIAQRFNRMIEQGFEQEVSALQQRGDLNLEMPSMRCVGYRQMWEYLEGNYSHNTMVEKSVVATRQLAKRQLTWLRKYQQVKRLDYLQFSEDEAFKYLEQAIANQQVVDV